MTDVYKFKVDLSEYEIRKLNFYFKCVKCIFVYVYSYKIKMYFNYFTYNLKYVNNCDDCNIVNLIDSLEKIYSIPNIDYLKKKYIYLNFLDNNIILNKVNYISNLFENYFLKNSKFPSIDKINYFNMYKIDYNYFKVYFTDLCNKYNLKEFDLTKFNIFLDNDDNENIFLILKKCNF